MQHHDIFVKYTLFFFFHSKKIDLSQYISDLEFVDDIIRQNHHHRYHLRRHFHLHTNFLHLYTHYHYLLQNTCTIHRHRIHFLHYMLHIVKDLDMTNHIQRVQAMSGGQRMSNSDFKKYAVNIREKATKYKKYKAKLAIIHSESVVLNRTEAILKSRCLVSRDVL